VTLGRPLGSDDEWTDFLAGLAATTVLVAAVTLGFQLNSVATGSGDVNFLPSVAVTAGAVGATAAYLHRRRNR